MAPSVCSEAKYSRNDPRILKKVVALRRQIGRVSQFPNRGQPRNDLSAGSQCGGRESQSALALTAVSILLQRAAAAADLGASFTSLRMAPISLRYSFMRAW